jgi:DNA-binding MarR family transcriptional regulator
MAEANALTRGERRCLELITRCDFTGQGVAVTEEELAHHLGYKRPYVSALVRALETKGRLTIEQRRHPGSRFTHNFYRVTVWNPHLRRDICSARREFQRARTRSQCDSENQSSDSEENSKRSGSTSSLRAQQAYIPSQRRGRAREPERKRMEFPQELRERRQWVCWRYELRAGKRTKIPTRPAQPSVPAASTEPATWGTFDQAADVLAAKRAAGVGFVFSPDDPYAGVDFDACVTGRTVHPAVASLVRVLDSYTEFSPSGTGLHVIVRAELVGDRRRTGKTPWGGEFENYDRARFFCMTADRVPGTPAEVRPRQSQLNAVRRGLFPPKRRPAVRVSGPLIPDDEALLEKARRARNGAAFEALWRGDWRSLGYPSQSEADLALCGRLAFWTAGDAERIDRLFRRSGLMRPKWERVGPVVIDTALGR